MNGGRDGECAHGHRPDRRVVDGWTEEWAPEACLLCDRTRPLLRYVAGEPFAPKIDRALAGEREERIPRCPRAGCPRSVTFERAPEGPVAFGSGCSEHGAGA